MNADTLDALADVLRNLDAAAPGFKLQGDVHIYDYDAPIGTKAFGRISLNDEDDSTFVPVAA